MSRNGSLYQDLRLVLSWGFLWGAAEASLGHILHAIPVPGLAGLVMVPVGLFAMSRVFASTGRPSLIPLAACAAAAVKMADLGLPGRGPVMTLRPALAILAEGLAVAVLYAASARQVGRRPA